MNYILTLVACVVFASCSVGTEPEVKKYIDPVSGKEMNERVIGEWILYTYVENENDLIMVARKSDKSKIPIVSIINPENKHGAVYVFRQGNPEEMLVSVNKAEGSNELNKITFRSSGEQTKYHKALLKNEMWQYEEHLVKNASNNGVN